MKKADAPVARALIEASLDISKRTKMRSIYEGIAPASDGAVHSFQNPAGTETTRFSHSSTWLFDPGSYNLATLPKKTALADALFRVRDVIIPHEGRALIAADYSRAEARWCAYIAGDEKRIKLQTSGVDEYRIFAALVMWDDEDRWEEVPKHIRNSIGKCIAAGSLVPIDGKGLIPIEEVQAGDFVCGNKVVAARKTGVRRVVRVTTKAAELLCTPDHQIKISLKQTRGGERRFAWKAAEDLQEGDVLIAPPQNIKDPDYVTLPWGGVNVGEWADGVSAPKVVMDENWARWFGLLYGDGSFNGGTIRYFTVDPELMDDYVALCAAIGFTTGDVREVQRTTKVGLTCDGGSASLRRFMESVGAGTKRGEDFNAPTFLWKSPESVRCAFLGGMFDTDGYVASHGCPSICTRSYEFFKDLVQLFRSVGIGVYGRKMYNKGYDKFYWEVYVYNRSLDVFKEKIPIKCNHKRERLATLSASTKGRWEDRDVVVSVESVAVELPVYDLELEGEPEFYANSLCVHNCGILSGQYQVGWGTLKDSVNDDYDLHGVTIDAKTAKKMEAIWPERFPRTVEWWNEVRDQVLTHRFTVNPFGRRRYYFERDDRESARRSLVREAIADGPQSANAMALNGAIRRLYHKYDPKLLRLLLNVHDEILLDCAEDDVAEVARRVREEMEIPFEVGGRTLVIPAEVNVTRTNWSQMEEIPAEVVV